MECNKIFLWSFLFIFSEIYFSHAAQQIIVFILILTCIFIDLLWNIFFLHSTKNKSFYFSCTYPKCTVSKFTCCHYRALLVTHTIIEIFRVRVKCNRHLMFTMRLQCITTHVTITRNYQQNINYIHLQNPLRNTFILSIFLSMEHFSWSSEFIPSTYFQHQFINIIIQLRSNAIRLIIPTLRDTNIVVGYRS